MMTQGILDDSSHGNLGCPHLFRALKRCKPRMHLFGHIHEGYGAKVVTWNGGDGMSFGQADNKENCYPASTYCPMEFGRETLCVNASIVDGRNRPRNDP